MHIKQRSMTNVVLHRADSKNVRNMDTFSANVSTSKHTFTVNHTFVESG